MYLMGLKLAVHYACDSILNLSTPKTFALRTTIEEQNIEILSSQNSVPLTVTDVRYILGMIPVQ
jgi:hypothetical protein